MKSSRTALPFRPSLGDRIGIVVFIVVGIAIVVWTAFATIGRIAQAIAGTGIPASANLIGVEAEAPIGPGGSMLPVHIDRATVTATELSSAGLGGAILGQLTLLGTITTVVVCLILLARNSLRGKIFSRNNTRLIAATGMTALLGFGLGPVFEGMVANDTISRLSDGDFTNYAILTIEPMPFVLLAFAFAIVATAFTVGARIQRDTEGLV